MNLQNLEDEIVEALGQAMSESIDFDILCDVMIPFGWNLVQVEYSDAKPWIDVMSWFDNNCTGDYKEHKGKWLIKNTQDAIMFKLKWG